jgi:hypothetical protein
MIETLLHHPPGLPARQTNRRFSQHCRRPSPDRPRAVVLGDATGHCGRLAEPGEQQRAQAALAQVRPNRLHPLRRQLTIGVIS